MSQLSSDLLKQSPTKDDHLHTHNDWSIQTHIGSNTLNEIIKNNMMSKAHLEWLQVTSLLLLFVQDPLIPSELTVQNKKKSEWVLVSLSNRSAFKL